MTNLKHIRRTSKHDGAGCAGAGDGAGSGAGAGVIRFCNTTLQYNAKVITLH